MPVENFSNFQATITPLTGDYVVGYSFADPVNKLNPFETRTTLKQIFDSYTSYSSNLSGIAPNQLSTGHPSWDQYGSFTIPNQLTVNGAPSYFGNGTIRASIYPDNSNNGVTIESADYANVNKKDLYIASRGGNVAIGTVTPRVSGLTVSGSLSASGSIMTYTLSSGNIVSQNIIAGTVVANTTGTHTGPVIGNVTGNVSGIASALAPTIKFPNFGAVITRSYNTVYQAATDGFLNVDCGGQFRNGIQVVVGYTSSPSIRIWAAGDDINVNTKVISSGLLPIPAGVYYQVAPYLYDAFESIYITWYPAN